MGQLLTQARRGEGAFVFFVSFFFNEEIEMTPRKKRERYRRNAALIAKESGIEFDPDDWEQIWALLDEHAEPTYLYAIFDCDKNAVKFGRSKTPRLRLGTIKTGNIGHLVLLGYCEHKPPFTEKEVHTELSGHRLNGEWFAMCNNVQAKINQIRAEAGYG